MESFDKRLARYKRALVFIQKRVKKNGYRGHGICYALTQGRINKMYPHNSGELHQLYPEIYKRHPRYASNGDKINMTFRGFWWSSFSDHNKRIALLEKVIAKMEAGTNPK